ncbi:hypothetical protein COY48_03065 [Candidatus Collierbacteria bacterium CG_4_10_14_0_8_um_filter_43_86]|nr:MAG: hypothetical protein COY48_03065 [Candidatus Collierbacteria bacterium CG_4_10_14_0_8_um_filter_43_86]
MSWSLCFFGLRGYLNRVPEPAPATAYFGITDEGFGVVIDISMENIAYDCKLGKKTLTEMNEKTTLETALLGLDTVTPVLLNVPVRLPDGRRFEDTYYLRVWNDELILTQEYCHDVK